jgi:hypothetical protein
MAASVPQIPKIIIFTLGSGTPKSFAEDVVNLRIEPVDPTESIIVTLDGVVHKDVGPGSWNLVGQAVQDWDSARPGFAQWAYANAGTSVPFVFKNETGTEAAATPKFTGTVVVKALGYGGDGGAFATTDFTWPITGTLTLDSTP